jgi:Spy/CpxP family protein refolding chaperone
MRSTLSSFCAFALALCLHATASAQMAGGHQHGGGPGSAAPKDHGGMGDCDSDSCPMMKMKGGGEGGCPMMHGGKGGHGHMDPMDHMDQMGNRMADMLGLPDATRKKLNDIGYEAEKQSIAIRADLEQAKLDMSRLMAQEKPDSDLILKQVEKMGQLKTELKKIHVRAMLECRKLLTPDQRKKMEDHMHGRMEHSMN